MDVGVELSCCCCGSSGSGGGSGGSEGGGGVDSAMDGFESNTELTSLSPMVVPSGGAILVNSSSSDESGSRIALDGVSTGCGMPCCCCCCCGGGGALP